MTQPRLIAHRYLRVRTLWFCLDLVSAIPLELVLDNAGLPWWCSFFRLVRLVRLVKLPRVLNSNRWFTHVRAEVSSSVLTLWFGLTFLFYVAHLLGCLYLFIVRRELQELDGVELDNGWLPPTKAYDGDTGHEPLGTDRVLGPQSYLFSLWWAICAMSGTAVATPQTAHEFGFTIVVVLAGFIVVAFVIGLATTALTQLSAAASALQVKRDAIEAYLKARRIPQQLRRQVEHFHRFVGAAGEGEEEAALSELPVGLRLQLDLVINRNVFLKVPFFSNLDVTQITVIVPRIQHEYVWPAKVVVYEGLLSPGLYTVVRGFAKTTSGGTLQGLLTHADFFGEESLLSDAPAPLTTQAVSQCQFMILDREDFADVLELYPKIHTALVRHQRLKDKSTKTPTAKRQTMIQQLQKARRRAASPDLADLAASRLHHH